MTDSISAVQPAIPQEQIVPNNIAPCAPQTPGAMATDFFGSQAFGNPMQMPAAPSFMSQQPDDVASALVQQSYSQNNPSFTGAMGGASMEDYARATQIANQFANSQPLPSPYTSYFENDYFAHQLIPPSNNNGMAPGMTPGMTPGMNYMA